MFHSLPVIRCLSFILPVIYVSLSLSLQSADVANRNRDSAAASQGAGARANRSALSAIENSIKKDEIYVKKEREHLKEELEKVNIKLQLQKQLLAKQEVKAENDLKLWKEALINQPPTIEKQKLAKVDALYAKIRREKNLFFPSSTSNSELKPDIWSRRKLNTTKDYVENLSMAIQLPWPQNEDIISLKKLRSTLNDSTSTVKEVSDAANVVGALMAPNECQKEVPHKHVPSWLKPTELPLSSFEDEDDENKRRRKETPPASPTVSELVIDESGASGPSTVAAVAVAKQKYMKDITMGPDDFDEDESNLASSLRHSTDVFMTRESQKRDFAKDL